MADFRRYPLYPLYPLTYPTLGRPPLYPPYPPSYPLPPPGQSLDSQGNINRKIMVYDVPLPKQQARAYVRYVCKMPC